MIFFKSKKADGMSINVIVVAAIALIVLVVLTAIFAGRMKTSGDKQDKSTGETLSKVCTGIGRYCNSTDGQSSTCKGSNTNLGKDYIDCSGVCCPSSWV